MVWSDPEGRGVDPEGRGVAWSDPRGWVVDERTAVAVRCGDEIGDRLLAGVCQPLRDGASPPGLRMKAPPTPELALTQAGYRPGDRLTRNLAPHFAVAGGLFAVVHVAISFHEGRSPSLVFLAWIGLVTGIVSTWHSRRPQTFYETDGLRIGGRQTPWSAIRSISLSDFTITIYVGAPDEQAPLKIEMSRVPAPRR